MFAVLVTGGLGGVGCGDDGAVALERPPAAAIVAEPAVVADATPDEAAVAGVLAPDEPGADDPEGDAEDPATPEVPDEPYKVLLLGDSMAATGFGVILQKRLDAHPHVRCFRKAKSASGLARPDFFDWMAEGKRQVELRDPDLVLVILGGNDGQDLTNERGVGKRVHWDSDGWDDAYKERMASFLEEVSDEGARQVMWLGLPKMGQRGLERKLELIRGVQRDAIADLGDKGTYLDTIPFLVDDEGALLREVKVNKRTQRVREDDGVHFTMPGSQYFADQVYPQVLNVLRLEPVDP